MLPPNMGRPGCAGVSYLTSLLLLCYCLWQRVLGVGGTPDVQHDPAKQPAVPQFSGTAGVAPERTSLGQRGCRAAALHHPTPRDSPSRLPCQHLLRLLTLLFVPPSTQLASDHESSVSLRVRRSETISELIKF